MASTARATFGSAEHDVAVFALMRNDTDFLSALRTAYAGMRYSRCSRIDEAAEMFLRAAPVDVLVAGLTDADGMSTIGTMRAFHIAHPRLVVVAFCSRSDSDSHLLLEAARSAHFLIRQGIDNVQQTMRDAISASRRATHPTLASMIESEMGGKYPCAEAFVACVLADTHLRRASAIARTLGVSRRTQSQQFRRAGLPSPGEFLTRLRLLRAIHMLCYDDGSVRAIAKRVGFTEPALRAAMRRRYTVPLARSRTPRALALALATLTSRTTSKKAETT